MAYKGRPAEREKKEPFDLENDRWITMKTACELIDMDVKTFKKHVVMSIPLYTIGKRHRFRLSELLAFMEKNKL